MVQNNRSNTIVIVGASRGIGLGLVREYLARGWQVIATQRSGGADSALGQLAKESAGALIVESLDINEPAQIAQLAQRLQGQTLDVLLVNAGVMPDRVQTIAQFDTEAFSQLMQSNVLGPMRVIEALDALVTPKGTIAAMSSVMASITENTSGGAEAYRTSKAALNASLRSYSLRAGQARSVLALHPGWVRTDMGGENAPVSVQQSVQGLADTIAARSGTAGLLFVDYQNQTHAW